MSPESDGRSIPPRRTIIAAAAALVVVLALVIWLFTRGGSDDTDTTATGSTPSPSAGTSPSPSGDGTPSSSPTASGDPSSASPSDPPSTVNTVKPLVLSFDKTATPLRDVDLEVTQVETIVGKGRIPGEISGPALRISLTATNDTDRAIAVNTTVANLYYAADRTPASPLIKSGADPFPASIRAGASATGVFVFTVPKDDRDPLRLEVILGSKFRVVEFSGSCPEDC